MVSFGSAFPFASSLSSVLGAGGEELEALDLDTFERLERADRARERILLVSESRGTEMRPEFLGVQVDPEAMGERASPVVCWWPLV